MARRVQRVTYRRCQRHADAGSQLRMARVPGPTHKHTAGPVRLPPCLQLAARRHPCLLPGERRRAPAITDSSVAASVTLCAIGPTQSREEA